MKTTRGNIPLAKLCTRVANFSALLIAKNSALLFTDYNVALGRKNYLFAGSHEAAKRSGMLYSLLGTCKMHNVEPYAWLKAVLQKIADHPINKIQELLPHYYKA